MPGSSARSATGRAPGGRVRWVAPVGLGIIALILVANALLALQNMREVAVTEGSVAETHADRFALGAVLSAVQDAEVGRRGFLITGRDSDLEPYRQALVVVRARTAELVRGGAV